jgi:hypothetical protein
VETCRRGFAEDDPASGRTAGVPGPEHPAPWGGHSAQIDASNPARSQSHLVVRGHTRSKGPNAAESADLLAVPTRQSWLAARTRGRGAQPITPTENLAAFGLEVCTRWPSVVDDFEAPKWAVPACS